jgi:cytochrome c-type biogenesis protein CcmF
MTEAGIDGRLSRDIYVSLGEPLADGRWALRLYYKPMVRAIWLGGLLMVLGGLLCVADRRYRRPLPASLPAAAPVPQPGASPSGLVADGSPAT